MALRACIIFTLLLISPSAYSQLEGGYLNKEEGYYFWQDGEFSWYSVKSKVKSLGRGTYTIKNDSISLTFGEVQREFELQAQVPTRHGLSHSVVAVNAMRSPSGKPFAGLKFELNKSQLSGETDNTGTARITIENPLPNENIHFELDGYRTVDIPLELMGKDFFFAIVVDETTRYVENSLVQLKLKKTGKKLVLNGTVYKKVSKRVFLDRSLS